MFTYVYFCLLFFSYWVCWVRGNFSDGPGHIFSVCVTPLCAVPGRYQFSGTFLERMSRLYRFFFFSGSVVAGTVRLKWWTGVLSFSFFFLHFAVSPFGGWMSVVGFCVLYNSMFFGRFVVYFFRGFVFCKLLMFLNLLQVVQAE